MEFGDILRQLRIANKLTQQELADKLSLAYGHYISRGSISNWEAKTRTPKFEVYEVIADYFNVDMEYLRGNQQSPELEEEVLTLSSQEKAFILWLRSLPPEKRQAVLNFQDMF